MERGRGGEVGDNVVALTVRQPAYFNSEKDVVRVCLYLSAVRGSSSSITANVDLRPCHDGGVPTLSGTLKRTVPSY